MPRTIGPRFSVFKKTTLAGAPEIITIQQPASGSKKVYFEFVQVHCTVAAVIEIERDGAAATATALTAVDASKRGSVTATAWSGSDVGAGAKISEFDVAAGQTVTVNMDGYMLAPGGGTGENLTLRSDSITGDIKITIVWRED